MSVRSTVTAQFKKVASEQKKTTPPLTDDLKLLESGFDSLDFALVITYLEDSLGCDPFEAGGDMIYPVTFGDFVKLYESRSKAPLPT